MYTTIDEIFDEICNNVELSEDYYDYKREFDNCYKKLNEGLSEEKIKQLEELCCNQNGLEIEYGLCSFKKGFKYAFKLIIESLT